VWIRRISRRRRRRRKRRTRKRRRRRKRKKRRKRVTTMRLRWECLRPGRGEIQGRWLLLTDIKLSSLINTDSNINSPNNI
jgi:hypothetical protein